MIPCSTVLPLPSLSHTFFCLATTEGAEAVKRAREKEYWQANDYYSSDEDTFLDRTGQVVVRRKKRMRKMGIVGA